MIPCCLPGESLVSFRPQPCCFNWFGGLNGTCSMFDRLHPSWLHGQRTAWEQSAFHSQTLETQRNDLIPRQCFQPWFHEPWCEMDFVHQQCLCDYDQSALKYKTWLGGFHPSTVSHEKVALFTLEPEVLVWTTVPRPKLAHLKMELGEGGLIFWRRPGDWNSRMPQPLVGMISLCRNPSVNCSCRKSSSNPLPEVLQDGPL